MKKILGIIFCLIIGITTARADFAEHYNAGQIYLSQYQYSSAITEFKKALRINFLDNSARIGLVNSYMARGAYFANKEKNWEKAADDYRAAIFYLQYYAQAPQNSIQAISNATENLNQCLNTTSFNTAPASRYKKAIQLRAEGNFAAAGYEFAQSLGNSAVKKDSLIQLADIMKVLGNDNKAAEYYQKAVAMNPDDATLRLKYARVLDKLNQDELAVKEYNFALTRSSADPEILYALERIYRKKLVEKPNDAELIGNLGAILQKEGKFDEALQHYSKAEYLNPSNVTTRLNVGTLYQAKKDYQNAIQAYDSVLALYPNNADANLYKAQCLAASGNKTQALEGFKTVLRLDPTNSEAKKQLFETLKATMTPAEMLSYLSQDAGVDKQSIDAMYDYALDLHKQNKFDDAISYYKEVLKQRGNTPEVYINLAIAYGQKKDFTSATSTLNSAALKFPANKQISDALISIKEEAASGQYTEAADLFNKQEYQKALDIYMRVQPQTEDSLIAIASCYQNLNNTNSAIDYYKKALNINPNNSDVAYYLGVIYSEKENWSQAKIYLQKSLAANKNNAKASDLYASVVEQNNIGVLNKAIDFYEKANYVESLKLISQILTDDNKNAYAYYYRGMIYDAQKKYQQAVLEYKKALQYNPDLVVANYLLAIDYDSLAQYKVALGYYKKFVSMNQDEDEYKQYAKTRITELKKYE